MISFRDQGFCTAPCKTSTCHRNVTPEVLQAAERWWGGPGAPIAYSDFWRGCLHFDYDYDRAPTDPHHGGKLTREQFTAVKAPDAAGASSSRTTC